MANNFSIEHAREKLACKTGIPAIEFMHVGVSREGNFTRHKFYKGTDRTILYTVYSEDEVNELDEYCPVDYAP